MNFVLPRTPAPLSRVLVLFCLLLISALLLPGLQAQQPSMTTVYHVMTKDADGNATCRMMSPAAAADLGLILDEQTRSLQPMEISPQQGGGAGITVTYNGFTAEAQAAFQFAVDIWAALLDIDIPIVVDATFAALGGGRSGQCRREFFLTQFFTQCSTRLGLYSLAGRPGGRL